MTGTDIAGREDLLALLADFYGRTFEDPLLHHPFVEVAHMDIGEHLPVIADFWETVVFRAGLYRSNAMQPHQRLHEKAGLTPAHFERWLALWDATIDERHSGPNADRAKRQGARMADAMCRAIVGEDSEGLRSKLDR